MISVSSCPFCAISAEFPHDRILAQNKYAMLVRDLYPVSDGHSLVVVKRHVGSFFDTGALEREAIFRLVDEAKLLIDKEFQPDAYNIGINDGPAAGQTVPHLHIHVIPRFNGDSGDPRGGVRWVIPDKAAYWKKSEDEV